jgi:serine/threonine-protein kinase RsbW
MDQQFGMTIGSDIAEIPEVSAWLEEVMRGSGFSEEAILDTQLAVEEAITNVIVHGYKEPGGVVEITSHVNSDRVKVEIADTAPRFDPLSMPEPDLDGSIEERRIGGLGVFLIRQVMDGVSYRYENGKNILVLIKNRTS